MDASLPPVDVGALTASPAGRAADAARAAALRGEATQAAHDLEKLFATVLVKELRRGLSDGFFGKGAGADVYEGWLDEHLGSALADGPGLGLRIALERDLGGGPTAAPQTGGLAQSREAQGQEVQP